MGPYFENQIWLESQSGTCGGLTKKGDSRPWTRQLSFLLYQVVTTENISERMMKLPRSHHTHSCMFSRLYKRTAQRVLERHLSASWKRVSSSSQSILVPACGLQERWRKFGSRAWQMLPTLQRNTMELFSKWLWLINMVELPRSLSVALLYGQYFTVENEVGSNEKKHSVNIFWIPIMMPAPVLDTEMRR